MNTVINSAKHQTEPTQELMVNTLVHQSVRYLLYSQPDSNSVQIATTSVCPFFVIVTQYFVLVKERVTSTKKEEAAVYSLFDLARESGTGHKLTSHGSVAPTGQW